MGGRTVKGCLRRPGLLGLPGGRRCGSVGLAGLMTAIVACCLVSGCGARGPARGVVRGRVTLGDRPVTDARVVFSNGESGAALQVPLDASGGYEARTYQGSGLVVGTYQVAIVPGTIRYTRQENEPAMTSDQFKVRNPAAPAVKSSDIPKRYVTAETSGLSIEVKPGDNPPFDFALQP